VAQCSHELRAARAAPLRPGSNFSFGSTASGSRSRWIATRGDKGKSGPRIAQGSHPCSVHRTCMRWRRSTGTAHTFHRQESTSRRGRRPAWIAPRAGVEFLTGHEFSGFWKDAESHNDGAANSLSSAGPARLLGVRLRSCGARQQPGCCPRLPSGHGCGQLRLRAPLGGTLADGAGSDVARVPAMFVLRVGGRVAAKRGHCRDDHAGLLGTWLRRLDRAPADVVWAC
jgi:hypothetical protein